MVGLKSGPRAFRRALPVSSDDPGQAPAATLEARSDETPTSQKLQPVLERPTTRRRRRPAQNPSEGGAPKRLHATGFPVPGDEPLVTRQRQPLSPSQPPPSSSFPPVDPEAGAGRSTGGGELDDAFVENDRIVESMSRLQIEEEVESLREMFSPEAFAALQAGSEKRHGRGLERGGSQAAAAAPRVSRSGSGARVSFAAGEALEDDFTYPSAHLRPRGDPRDEDPDSFVALDGDCSAGLSRMRAANGELAGVVDEVLSLKHAARAGGEEEKLAWTRPADAPVAGAGGDFDDAVRKSVEELGEAAGWRFDLGGRRLSEEEVRSLPMHLGLHHHGAQPEAAGYTLGELLLLVRSTVVSQRAAALQVFAGVFSLHGGEVIPALASAGGIAALLADVPTGSAAGAIDPGLVGNQNVSLSAAFLRCVFELVEYEAGKSPRLVFGLPDSLVDTAQLYFASSLYVAPDVGAEGSLHEKQPVIKLLGESSCVSRLILIAVAARSTGNVEVAIDALRVCMCITRYSSAAALSVAASKPTCMDLFDLASSFENEVEELSDGTGADDACLHTLSSSQSCVIMQCACEIISVCILAAGWAGELELLKRPKGLGDPDRLERLLMLRVDKEELQLCARESRWEAFACACSALRVLRSLFAFGLGIGAAARIARTGLPYLVTGALPLEAEADRRAQLSFSKVRAEAFLALESYVHSLFADVVAANEERENGPPASDHADSADDGDERKRLSEARVEFARGELQYLMSTALEAALYFTGVGISSSADGDDSSVLMDKCARSAAGHFVATMLAMTSVSKMLLNPEVVERVYAVARQAAESVDELAAKLCVEGHTLDPCFTEWSICMRISIVHAAGRLIPHSESLLLGNVEVIVLHLRKASTALDVGDGLIPSLPRETCCSTALNALVEWLGLHSRISPCVATAVKALDLLGRCSESQVCADLITRCVLTPGLLRFLAPDMTETQAAEAITDLLPRTLQEIFRNRGAVTAGDDEEGSSGDSPGLEFPLQSPRDLFAFWFSGEGEVVSSACTVLSAFRLRGVTSPSIAFQSLLLGVSPKMWFDISTNERIELGSALGSEMLASGAAAGAAQFSGDADTRMSSFSTTSSPPMATALLSLSELLIAHGPLSPDSPGGICAVATVLLNAVLRSREVDDSLRRVIWRTTVTDCGGLALYSVSRVLGDDDWADEEDALVPQYVELLCGPRGWAEGNETRDVFRAVVPSLLAGKSSALALMASAAGRRAVSQWSTRERSFLQSTLSNDELSQLEELCLQ